MRSDADTLLLFLSANNIMFTKPTNDPWYSAHQLGPVYASGHGNGIVQTYVADQAANVVGCAYQYQYCNPHLPPSSGCGPLLPANQDEMNNYDYSMFSAEQKAAFTTFWSILNLAPFAP